MRVQFITAWAVCLISLAAGTDAHGQMFGARRMGQPLARRPGPGALEAQENVGTLTGAERFLRDNRRPGDFVGTTERDLERFVGAIQARARGTVPLTTQGLRRRVDRSASVNQPVPPATRGTLYYPRLELSLDATAPDTSVLAQRALETLARSPELSGTSHIAVYVEGRTAILQGEVPSARDRELAELMLSFEPGISAIANELELNPNLADSEDSLAALRRQQVRRETWTTISQAPQPEEAAPPATVRRAY
jgi:hypothetical protein